MKCSIGCRKIVSQFYQKCVALQTSFLLHGFHHLVHSDRTVFEWYNSFVAPSTFTTWNWFSHFNFSCFWWLMICAGFWGGILTASVFVKRHIESPTVVSIERDYTTWNTTFPSFTLCSKRKMNESALQNYLKWEKMRKRLTTKGSCSFFALSFFMQWISKSTLQSEQNGTISADARSIDHEQFGDIFWFCWNQCVRLFICEWRLAFSWISNET